MAIGFFVAINLSKYITSVQFLTKKEETKFYCGTISTNTNTGNSNGRTLFSQNCASCHAVNKQLTGPALAGVLDRVADRKILYQWIRNSESVLKSGDPYFVDLYNKFNKTPMNQFPSLTNEDIDAILDYIGN